MLTLSCYKLNSSGYVTISITGFISSFDIISIVLLLLCEAAEEKRPPDPKLFLCIPASTADAAAVNPKEIKTLLAGGLATFFISSNLVF